MADKNMRWDRKQDQSWCLETSFVSCFFFGSMWALMYGHWHEKEGQVSVRECHVPSLCCSGLGFNRRKLMLYNCMGLWGGLNESEPVSLLHQRRTLLSPYLVVLCRTVQKGKWGFGLWNTDTQFWVLDLIFSYYSVFSIYIVLVLFVFFIYLPK